MDTATELRARLVEAERIATDSARRVIEHGERALLRERRRSERRALAVAIRKLRRLVEEHPPVMQMVPHPAERRVPLRTVTQPIQRGAP